MSYKSVSGFFNISNDVHAMPKQSTRRWNWSNRKSNKSIQGFIILSVGAIETNCDTLFILRYMTTICYNKVCLVPLPGEK